MKRYLNQTRKHILLVGSLLLGRGLRYAMIHAE
uniref:Uncharacterized protein n=1 Tax=Moniliophthora roreri TaxID=221103 RepID=A0A0W0FBZ3_MONRR